jgi:hypothetical protein
MMYCNELLSSITNPNTLPLRTAAKICSVRLQPMEPNGARALLLKRKVKDWYYAADASLAALLPAMRP